MAFDDSFNSTISKGKIEVNIDFSEELSGLSRDLKSSIKEDIINTLSTDMATDLNNQKSSVTGKNWKGLSKDYKAKKREEGKGTKANLELDGDMLGDMEMSFVGNKLRIKIKNGLEKKKAFNHITGDTLPKRNFLPDEGETFRSGIMSDIKKIIKEGKSGGQDN